MDFLNLTQFVNSFSQLFKIGAQFQNIKGFALEGRWFLQLEFFPDPKVFVLGLNSINSSNIDLQFEKLKGLHPDSHPLILYLRAHLINQRVGKVEVLPKDEMKLCFLPSNSTWTMQFEDDGRLTSVIEIPDRKTYRTEIKLRKFLKTPEQQLQTSKSTEQPALDADQQSHQLKAEKRKNKLLLAVEGDMARAETWLLTFEGVMKILTQNPAAWGTAAEFPQETLNFILAASSKGDLPPFDPQYLGNANDKLFSLLRKMKRRKEGAAKRLAEISRKYTWDEKQAHASENESHQAQAKKSYTNKQKGHSARPGRRVELLEGVVAWVGQSASENSELYRFAKSRDLWFHVRGHSGGHVWIPRGQSGFGAKDLAPESLIIDGAKLAVYNSKLRTSSREGEVDYCERRFLKKTKGAGEGMISILRSETRFVRLDEEFEKRLKGK